MRIENNFEVIGSTLPIEVVSLKARHNADDPAVPCDICAGPTQKIYMSHECWGAKVIIRTSDLPAYRCGECGVHLLKLDAFAEFLSEALTRVVATGDSSMARILREELTLARYHQRHCGRLE